MNSITKSRGGKMVYSKEPSISQRVKKLEELISDAVLLKFNTQLILRYKLQLRLLTTEVQRAKEIRKKKLKEMRGLK